MKPSRWAILSLVAVVFALVVSLSYCSNHKSPNVNTKISFVNNNEGITTVLESNINTFVAHLMVGIEKQGTKISGFSSLKERDFSTIHQWEGPLQSSSVITFSSSLSQEEGQTLIAGRTLHLPPFYSSSQKKVLGEITYHLVGNFSNAYPISYEMTCSKEKISIVVKNSGQWGNQAIGLYLNENIETPWLCFFSEAGKTTTFNVDSVPPATRLIEADVVDHKYHESRTYCIPTQKE